MSKINEIDAKEKGETKFPIAEPHDLPPRSKWLRDYYFKGSYYYSTSSTKCCRS